VRGLTDVRRSHSDQRRTKPSKLLDHFLDLVVFEPRIDDLQLLPQHGQRDDLGEIPPVSFTGELLGGHRPNHG
jgi:hypothetical protein